MKSPWIKLWCNVFADEKVAFIMRRYGHEAAIFWIGILTQAEDGILMMDEDVFADLIQIEEKRYAELRGVMIKRGLVIEDDAGRLEIPKWDEYQVGESTARVRAYRERQKAAETGDPQPAPAPNPLPPPPLPERYGNATETKMERVEGEGEGEFIHTPPASKNEGGSQGTATPLSPSATSAYPRALLEAWRKLGDRVIQPPNEIHFLSASMPRILPHVRGIHSSEVLQAIANFGEIVLAPPGKYFWDARITIEIWVERHLQRFLPTAFKATDFLIRERSGPRREEPYRPPLLETYEPIPEENFRPPSEDELQQVADLVGDGRPKQGRGKRSA